MAELIWTEKATADLERIYDFIAVDSPFYARAQVQRILRAVERLKQFPDSGRSLPEFPQLIQREIIVGSYRVYTDMTKRQPPYSFLPSSTPLGYFKKRHSPDL